MWLEQWRIGIKADDINEINTTFCIKLNFSIHTVTLNRQIKDHQYDQIDHPLLRKIKNKIQVASTRNT